MITLEQLLASRDERRDLQQRMLAEHRGLTLVCMTVVMPGSEKRNERSLIVAHAGVENLVKEFGSEMVDALERDLETGYEYYFMTSEAATATKRRTCKIEDEHPLGRLFDIDVMGEDGVPLSRQEVGGEARRCLLCDKEARFCMRNHTHSEAELQSEIDRRIANFLKG